jgi:hypothetical protein
VREVAEVMNMSKKRGCHKLSQHLGMWKLSARCLPRLLETRSNEHFQHSADAV